MELIITLYDIGLIQLQKNGLNINIPQSTFIIWMNLDL